MFWRRTHTRKIKKLMKACGVSQTELASKIGYTREHFNNVIHRRNGATLNPQKVPAVAEALGVSVKEVVRLFGLRSIPTLGDDGFEPPTSCL